MSIAQSLLPEFDMEMKTTRLCLQRVPNDKLGWKPHEKSMTMGKLAGHLAEIPGWMKPTIEQDELDLNPPGGPSYTPKNYTSLEEILMDFDKNVVAAREALAKAPDSGMPVKWSLLFSGNPVFSMPRAAVVRAFIFSHTIHHRAQLGVYLRLNDIPVPSVYGPSADEGGM